MKLTITAEHGPHTITIQRGLDEGATLLVNVFDDGGNPTLVVSQFAMNKSEAKSFVSWLSAMVY